jgi:DNA-binding MarR family transcriptional regulator
MPEDENIAEQHTEQETVMGHQEAGLLQALLEKGPALPVELAVRTLSFPEEIADPLANLEQEGYVERQQLQKGEMFVLTKKGHQRVLGE